jgi:hypothetical protein
MILSRQIVICLLLAVDTQKALRLHSNHKSHQKDSQDSDWQDTIAASALTD